MAQQLGAMVNRGVTGMLQSVGLAAQDTETYDETNDRVSQLSTAAFMSVSQQSVTPYIMGRTVDQRLQAALDIPASLATQAERFFIVDTFQWKTSNVLFERISNVDLPKAFMDTKKSVYGNLAFHTFLRCGFEIQVQANPTPFQQGSILVVAIPWQAAPWGSGLDELDISLRSLMTLPHVLINCNINNTGSMKIPYLYTRNLYAIHGSGDQLWHLMAVVIAPLRRGPSTSSVVGVRILARMVDIEMHGLRPYTEPQMMRVSINPSFAVLNACNAASTAPEIDMSLGPEMTPPDSTSAGGLEVKDMAKQIQSLCWLGMCTISSTNPAGTLLYEHAIKPESPTIQFWGKKHPTNLDALSQYYAFWRGDMEYNLQINCTRYHSGRIMVSYIPRCDKHLTFEDHISSAVLFFDINGVNTTARFRVPYESTTMYTKTAESIGLLTIWVVNQLACPESVSASVDIVIMERGTENFTYFAPTWAEMAQAGEDEVAGPGSLGAKVEDQGASATVVADNTQLSAASAVEDPATLVSKDGTFPEVKPGKRSHTVNHVMIRDMMGRGRFLQLFDLPEGAFHHYVDLDFTAPNGPLRGLLRLGYMYRGAISVLVMVDSANVERIDYNSVINVSYLPVGVPEGEYGFTSSGFARMCVGQTSSMKLKIPWYTLFTAICPWGGSDVSFGKLCFYGHLQFPVTVRLDMAFTNESQLLFPMPVQHAGGYNAKNMMHRLPWDQESLTSGPEDDEDAHSEDVFGDTGGASGGPEFPDNETENSFVITSATPGKNPFEERSGAYSEASEEEKPRKRRTVDEVYKGMANLDLDEDFVGHSAPAFQVGDLLTYRINPCAWHFAVYAGEGCIIHLRPENDDSYLWGFSKDGEILHEPMDMSKKWKVVGHSPFPDLTMTSALGSLGPVPYHLMNFNCETFARQCCFLPAKDQVEHILDTAVVVAGVAAVTSVTATKFIAQGATNEDEETPKKKKKSKIGGFLSRTLSDSYDKSAAVSGVSTKVGLAAEEMGDLTKKLKKILDPKKLFKKFAGAQVVYWGSRMTGFVLDIVAYVLEIVAMLRSEGEIRGMLIGALASRFGSTVMSAVTMLSSVWGTIRGHGGSESEDVEEDAKLNDGIKKVLNLLVEHAWCKATDTEFVGQGGGLFHQLQKVNTTAAALTSVQKLMVWIKEVLKSVKAWLKPELASSVRRRLCSKMAEKMPSLALKVARVTSATPVTLADKRALHRQAKDVHRAILFWIDVVNGAKSDMDKSKALHQLMQYQTRVAAVILNTQCESSFSRVEPVVMYMYGKKGCGKSVSSVAIAMAICKENGWDPKDEIYTKPCSSEYYDGYGRQKIMIIDDIGQNTDGGDWQDFCQLVSTATMRLNMAHLSDKGAVFETPYIIATSNDPLPKPSTITDHSAVYRRLQIMVEVTPDTECVTNGVLDLAKAKKLGKIKQMACCKFNRHVIVNDKTTGTSSQAVGFMTFPALIKSFMKRVAMKTSMHLEIMDLVSDAIGQGKTEVDEEIAVLEDDDSLKTRNFDLTKIEFYPPSKNPFELDDYESEDDEGCPGYMDVDLSDERGPVWRFARAIRGDKRGNRTAKMVVYGMLALSAILTVLAVGVIAVALVKRHQRNKAEPERAYTTGERSVKDLKVREVKAPPSEAGQSHSAMAASFRKNVYPSGYRKNGVTTMTGYCTFIKSRTLVCVKHCVPEGMDFVFVDDDELVVVASSGYKRYDLAGDLSVITLPVNACSEKKDITGMLTSASIMPRLTQTYAVGYSDHKSSKVLPFANLRAAEDFDYGHPGKEGDRIKVPKVWLADGTAFPGACGAPWMSCSPLCNFGMVGIHVAGSATRSVCQVLTKEDVEGILDVCGHSKIVAMRPFLGHISSNTKTAYMKSELHAFISSNKVPAPLGCWDQRVSNDPKCQFLMKHRSPPKVEPEGFRDVIEFAKTVTNQLRIESTGYKGQHMFTDLDVIIEGKQHFEGLDMKTSAGWPWNDTKTGLAARKHELITKTDDGYTMRADLASRVQAIVDYIMEPEPVTKPEVKYTVYLKDELITEPKCALGRTRAISAAPLSLVLAWKHIFGAAICSLHRVSPCDKKSLGVAVGCDPNVDWTQIMRTRSGWPVFALDYSNYDGTLNTSQISGACEVLAFIAGLDEMCGRKAAEFIHTVTQIQDDTEYVTCGPLPSGSPSTSLIGCIVNWLTCVYTLCKITRRPVYSCGDWMYMMSYGDDCLVWLSPDLNVSGEEFQKELFDSFGMTVTDAADKNKPPQLTTIEHASFLKRKFRVCSSYSVRVHPTMDPETVMGMLKWRKRNVSLQVMVFLTCEFMFHHGRKKYEEYTEWLRGVIRCAGNAVPSDIEGSIPPYDDLHGQWMNG